jgi:hypothetical protein
VIRYDLNVEVRDTVAVSTGAALFHLADRDVVGWNPVFEQAFYDARAVVAAGDDWYAVGHGHQARIDVFDLKGSQVAEIHWPDVRRPITDADKIEGAKWILAARITNYSASREAYDRATDRYRRKAIRGTAYDLTRFADAAPLVVAAYGHGNCLFLAGHSAGDTADGTASIWIGINVRTRELVPPFRFPRRRQVRAFDAEHAYTILRDANGIFTVERYRFPGGSCD